MNQKTKRNRADIVIAGAGAAGLMGAFLASRSGLKVVVLEAGERSGRKLAVAGGGHVNFCNRHLDSLHYRCGSNRDFCKPALEAFGLADSLAFMENLGLSFEEREGGKFFLVSRGSDLVQRLEAQCRQHGCKFLFNRPLSCLEKNDKYFSINNGELFCESLILAQGTQARPKLATNAPWRIAKNLGHNIIPAKPALTPLIYGKGNPLMAKFSPLAGISATVNTRLDGCGEKRQWHGELLFTHHGLSGPVILNSSLFWHGNTNLVMDFLPQMDFEGLIDANPARTPRSLLKRHLPERLVDALLPADSSRRKNAELSRAERKILAKNINCCGIPDLRPGGLAKAEVCAGGVDTREIVAESMESRLAPGVSIIGEMLDVTGELGGYNIHWAFASAFLAVRAILKKRGRQIMASQN